MLSVCSPGSLFAAALDSFTFWLCASLLWRRGEHRVINEAGASFCLFHHTDNRHTRTHSFSSSLARSLSSLSLLCGFLMCKTTPHPQKRGLQAKHKTFFSCLFLLWCCRRPLWLDSATFVCREVTVCNFLHPHTHTTLMFTFLFFCWPVVLSSPSLPPPSSHPRLHSHTHSHTHTHTHTLSQRHGSLCASENSKGTDNTVFAAV